VVQVSVDITERKQLELELLNVSNKERWQIGEDLHDGLGQYLTGILYLATSLRNQLVGLGNDEAETATRIAESADNALNHMRSIIRGLCLVPSEPEGLMTALSALAANTMNIYPIECTFTCDVPVTISDYTVVSHLFYIAQEAVCNAVKHSTCTTIHITLSQCRDRVKLLIRDNGNGLSMKSGEQSGMGLRSMRYRASIMGAKLEIRGTAGKGTTVSCQLPASRLRKKEHHHV
jgi:Signal transduction histidine kinase